MISSALSDRKTEQAAHARRLFPSISVVPCTYRVVDIDDVIMNTLGAYAGVRLLPFMARNSRFMGA